MGGGGGGMYTYSVKHVYVVLGGGGVHTRCEACIYGVEC